MVKLSAHQYLGNQRSSVFNCHWSSSKFILHSVDQCFILWLILPSPGLSWFSNTGQCPVGRLLSPTPQSSLYQSVAVHRICNTHCQHSRLIHSLHHLSRGRLSLHRLTK